jgi:spore coat polysaccharide biosynthesis protein SpsF
MNRQIIAVLQARVSSTRLPGKVLKLINGSPMIYWQINRMKKSTKIDRIVVATSDDSTDNELAWFLDTIDQEYIRGPLVDVLARFIKAEAKFQPEALIRLTGDCPFVMPDLIDEMVHKFQESHLDYISNIIELTYPDGLDIEIIKSGVLSRLNGLDLSASEREHVTLGILNRKNLFSTLNISNTYDMSHYRWTVDTMDDFRFIETTFGYFKGRETEFNFSDLKEYFGNYPQLNRIKHRNIIK